MMPLDKVADRYRNDAAFHAVVDSLQHLILNLELSPSEVREAAMFACYLVEMRRPAPAVVVVPAPGDRCGGTKLIATGAHMGERCPGCRACS